MKLETERLLLEPTHLKHADFLLELVNSPGWLDNIGDRKVYDLEAAQAYAQKAIDAWNDETGVGQYVMLLKNDLRPIGTCGIYKREGLEYPDVGFAVLTDFMRKGYSYEATKAVMEQVTKTLNPKRIEGITTQENIGSQKLLEKLGLRHVGMVNLPNDPETLMKFAIDFT